MGEVVVVEDRSFACFFRYEGADLNEFFNKTAKANQERKTWWIQGQNLQDWE